MIDEFLKKVYIKVKELFTQTDNPLYDSFYKDEEIGFEDFKKHAYGDPVIKMILEGGNLSDDKISYIASYIVNQIDRMYYLSGQYEKNKIRYCPDDGAVIKFDDDLGIWKCTECEWKGDL